MIKKLFRLFLFFPSITFNLLKAEVFPWAFLYVAYHKIAYHKIADGKFYKSGTKRFQREYPLVFLLIISTAVSLFYALLENIPYDGVRSLIAYLNVLLIYVFLLRCPQKHIKSLNKSIRYILLTFIILGLLQYIGVVGFLQPVFSFLVPRANAESLARWGNRGVTLLTSEPERASIELIFIYVTWVYLKNPSSKMQYLFDIFIFIYLILVIRSSTGLMLLCVYFLFKYKLNFLILISILIVLLPSLDGIFDSKAFHLLLKISSISEVGTFYQLMVEESGFRVISVVGSYFYALTHPFGGGVGLWQTSSIEALNALGVDASTIGFFVDKGNGNFISVRPFSYVAFIALDLGLVGIFTVIYLLSPLILLLKNYKDRIFPVLCLFLFSCFIYGFVGVPTNWICMALVYRNRPFSRIS
jgi:hypothetical protein